MIELYREAIHKLVDRIQDEKILKKIYTFIKVLLHI